MVRINIINPKQLSDQHLIAEYDEILMLIAYIKKYPNLDNTEPKEYCLGIGHMKFFKNKLIYLKKRHEKLKEEMKKRGFSAKKTVNISKFKKKLKNDWQPGKKDIKIIKERIKKRLKKRPKFYRYYRKHEKTAFFTALLDE